MKTPISLDSHRILILTGAHAGEEGVCLGKASDASRWTVSLDSSAAILKLRFESEFALLLNLREGVLCALDFGGSPVSRFAHATPLPLAQPMHVSRKSGILARKRAG